MKGGDPVLESLVDEHMSQKAHPPKSGKENIPIGSSGTFPMEESLDGAIVFQN